MNKLNPKPTNIPKLTMDLASIMEKEGISLRTLIKGLAEERVKSMKSHCEESP